MLRPLATAAAPLLAVLIGPALVLMQIRDHHRVDVIEALALLGFAAWAWHALCYSRAWVQLVWLVLFLAMLAGVFRFEAGLERRQHWIAQLRDYSVSW